MLNHATQGADQDTYTLRFSGEWFAATTNQYRFVSHVADALEAHGNGADILFGFGVFEGAIEASATVVLQATAVIVEALLDHLSTVLPQYVQWVHCEVSSPTTQYVDLNGYRKDRVLAR